MASRLRITGVILIIVGIVAWGAAGYTYLRTQESADALQGFSEAQDVHAQLQRGRPAHRPRHRPKVQSAILALLGETWRWPIVDGELDPDDPLVNTATEYMYQMATIAYHTLHGTQTVVLTETAEWDGDGEEGISADAPVYFGGEWDPSTMGEDAVFNARHLRGPGQRALLDAASTALHPLDGPARAQTWNGTVHGLFAELGVGAITASRPAGGHGHRRS